ncbi:MAG: AAA family ATPase [Sphingomonadaceae bacterium]
MEIRRLKLSGFKSFVEPAELRIEPGLTGVVGPNGCGKSNLLEAIRWVMGENSPKSMRSGGMEDVIFAGTANRPPRDFAEVVLHAADDSGEDLEIIRRIERGAGSAYRVNGRDVRAKDVSLAFADAATGAHSPALVSQGKIAQVIAAKPAQRRMMLEEAAGIAGLHVRRRDAEGKLRQTESNLARLEDLIAGIDTQITSLRRQARQAERYKDLSQKIQTTEAQLLFARWRDAAHAAQSARRDAETANLAVEQAQLEAKDAQSAQHKAAELLAQAREELSDRKQDASAHGHRMSALTSQLEAAEQRLSDLERQRQRLVEDRGEADRLTQDAALTLARLEQDIAKSQTMLAEEEARRPSLVSQLEEADRASRAAELALAKATADHAGVEAEWRVAEAEVQHAQSQLDRLNREVAQRNQHFEQMECADDVEQALADAKAAAGQATLDLQAAQSERETLLARKQELQDLRDRIAERLASAKAELVGVDREYQALMRDRDARKKQAGKAGSNPAVLDLVHVKPGYERALAGVLGRDAKAPTGNPPADQDGRFWTGASVPQAVPDSLLQYIIDCPPELSARLALVHCVPDDDGRILNPGEWLVTINGHLRRWDGFIARGEGSAEAARLEADNRLKELEALLPPLRETVQSTEAEQATCGASLQQIQQQLIAAEREAQRIAEAERQALRQLDQAEAALENHGLRMAELQQALEDLRGQMAQAKTELEASQSRRDSLPPPETGRASLDAAHARNEASRSTVQTATAALASHDQGLAVTRERTASLRSDMANWQSRSSEASRRLSDMARRLEEIAEEHAVFSAKPEGLMRELEQGEEISSRLGEQLAKAEAAIDEVRLGAERADQTLTIANEALAVARETRASLVAKADNEENRRSELARMSGEKFQCPPPLLAERFSFDADEVGNTEQITGTLDQLNSSRERIGPVNLVAQDELQRLEAEHSTSAEEQAELHEAVNRLRGSIGNLNREGRERLRAAFEQVNGHFQHLFTRLFEGGQAHLALVDHDDPLEAGLEIFAQPPGKRLQSLTLLSGGEQALTAIALIFALFLTNPAPICVLDEVDAPLDDANIDRFCDLLDAMSRETATRYLIVTHNAVTMSRMHRLFGVTMIEKGVSRLVSVDLGAAEELLAAE